MNCETLISLAAAPLIVSCSLGASGCIGTVQTSGRAPSGSGELADRSGVPAHVGRLEPCRDASRQAQSLWPWQATMTGLEPLPVDGVSATRGGATAVGGGPRGTADIATSAR
jgi:hypothetical protein